MREPKLSPEDQAARDRIKAGHAGKHKPLSLVTNKRRVPFSERMRRASNPHLKTGE
ncbi:hypothetical protein [Larkinella knui]